MSQNANITIGVSEREKRREGSDDGKKTTNKKKERGSRVVYKVNYSFLASLSSSSEKTPPETVLEELTNFFKSQRLIFFCNFKLFK